MNETHNTMSPESQQIAIAEARGWRGPHHPENIAKMDGWWSQHRGIWWVNPCGHWVMKSSVPDYLNDLNACHEFEIWLLKNHPDLRAVYRRILIECVGSDGLYWMATAAQRCEAFLKTIGKWEE